MSKVVKTKKGGQIGYALGAVNGKYTEVLFPFGRIAKSGDRGVTQKVRTDNLTQLREGYMYGD